MLYFSIVDIVKNLFLLKSQAVMQQPALMILLYKSQYSDAQAEFLWGVLGRIAVWSLIVMNSKTQGIESH